MHLAYEASKTSVEVQKEINFEYKIHICILIYVRLYTNLEIKPILCKIIFNFLLFFSEQGLVTVINLGLPLLRLIIMHLADQSIKMLPP